MDKMCQIQEIQYACGHKRKELVQACGIALRLGPMPEKRVPDFCLEGLQVVEITQVLGDCGRVSNDCSCRESQALKAFAEWHSEKYKELDSFSHRVQHVKDVLKLGTEPTYNWEQVKAEGWDIDYLMEDQVQTRNVGLPASFAKWSYTMPIVQNKLNTAFRLASNFLIEHLRCKDAHPGSEISRWLGTGTMLGEWYEEVQACIDQFENPLMQFLEDTWRTIRENVYEDLNNIELAAIRACLDDVGWQIPKGEEDRVKLGDALEWRVMAPARKSGMAPRAKFADKVLPVGNSYENRKPISG